MSRVSSQHISDPWYIYITVLGGPSHTLDSSGLHWNFCTVNKGANDSDFRQAD